MKLPDAPGASPRRRGAPFAIVPYYPGTKMLLIFVRVRGITCATPPTGAGLAQGGQSYHIKQVFSRATKKDTEHYPDDPGPEKNIKAGIKPMARFELATSSLPRRHTAGLCHIGILSIRIQVHSREMFPLSVSGTGCLTTL